MAAVASTNSYSVSGKTAIVTGAGSGINLAFANLLLQHNCNVVFADLGLRPEAQATIDKHQTGSPRAIFIKTDVTIWDQLENMFVVAEKEFKEVDIVCPGAGVYEPHWSNFWHPPGTTSSKDALHGSPNTGIGHYATLDINITHPIRTTQLALTRWLSSSPPKASPATPKRIVHISSVAGQVSAFAVPLYCASKHAISGFIRSLGPLEQLGVRVNGVAPGIIKTPLWTDHPEKMQYIGADDVWITAEETAERMLECVVSDEVGPGVVWEVLKGRARKVEERNDMGPVGEGSVASDYGKGLQEVFGWLQADGWGVPKQ